MPTPLFENKIRLLAQAGLNLFGSIKKESLPAELIELFKIQEKETLCLIGHGGKKLWEEMEAPPIDDYSKKKTLEQFPDARILFPDERSHFPLQQIGRLMNFGRQSPIGIDLNPQYGLWFAYRCLFLTKENIPQKNNLLENHACDTCDTKPCLKESDFHLARMSCPYKKEHRYTEEQIRYHQAAISSFY
jgi:hypothetical protein